MKEYNAKEVSVFEGVLSLVKSGENIYTLKVQQIADAAGIGKGTLYEYFSSREEIIAQSLVFSIDKQLDEFEKATNSVNGFYEKLCVVLDFTHEHTTENSSSFSLLNSAMNDPTLREVLCASMHNKQDVILKRMHSILFTIISTGRKEGIITEQSDDSYCLMTAISVLCTVAYTSSQGERLDTWQNIRKNALKMLCKALA